MTRKIKSIGFFLLLAASIPASAQTNQEKASEKGVKAIELMDKGQFDESIKLLKEAMKLDPESFTYPYEMAYAYYAKADYKEAIKILEKNKKHKEVNDRLFQLLGNSYDLSGNPEKAVAAYDEGLKVFPNSGEIYLEKGNLLWAKEKYVEALDFYEKGIEVNPEFPSNYYRAARIYCHSTEEVWGMIYGEIFMNLERNSKRTAEISKLLYDTYKSQITLVNDSSFSVSFSKNATINVTDLSDPSKIKLPYGIGFYEPALMIGLVPVKSIDQASLNSIRSAFVDFYINGENQKKYPTNLFDYQKKVKDAGHLEAYNYWILMKGDEDGFAKWQSANTGKWEAFIEWFIANPMKVTDENKFYSGQF
jgi:tetratricopeptide (TPR) repeat protein